MNYQRIATGVFAFFLAAVAVTPIGKAEDEGKGHEGKLKLVVHRPWSWWGTGSAPIIVNGDEVGQVKNGSDGEFWIEPGEDGRCWIAVTENTGVSSIVKCTAWPGGVVEANISMKAGWFENTPVLSATVQHPGKRPAAQKPNGQADKHAGKVKLTVHRPNHFYGRSKDVTVKVNGSEAGKVKVAYDVEFWIDPEKDGKWAIYVEFEDETSKVAECSVWPGGAVDVNIDWTQKIGGLIPHLSATVTDEGQKPKRGG